MTIPLLPPNFSLAHYRLTLTALDTLHLPPNLGNTLRGGFGHTFKRLVCVQPPACGQSCAMGNSCPYGYIFESSLPENTEVLRNLSEVPRPFILEPPLERRLLLLPGESLTFGLTLVGRAIAYLPYFIAVFREMGEQGLGRGRGRFRLQAIDAHLPGETQTEVVYRAGDDLVRTSRLALTTPQILSRAAGLPQDRLTLEFLTPTRLKSQGAWVNRGPDFQILVKSLLGRISSLSYFHCGQQFQTDFQRLVEEAARVEISQSQTHYEDWERFSSRQKQRIALGGLVGQITYNGPLQAYLPLLALGELVHAGKGTVFGNGQYRIENRNTFANETP